MQVALMVAQGGSNREVGASLFLSPKTIEHHLSTIFRKLGIKRRTELARALGADLPGESSMPSLVEP
jgi:DNA-binding NarL/FixJ family response regulator